MFDDEVVFYCLACGLAAIAAYIYFVQSPDTDPFILNVQAGISQLRHPGETAIYRSRITPFTGTLLSGLSIGKSAFSTRDGNLADIWELAKKASIGECSYGASDSVNPISCAELTRLVYGVGEKLRNSQNPIAVMLPNSIESLVLTFAGPLFGTPVVFIAVEDVSVQQLEEFLSVANPSSIVTTAEIIRGVRVPNNAQVYSVKGDISGAMSWKELASECSKRTAGDFPEFDESKVPISFIYPNQAGEVKQTVLSNQNIVSAVASQIKSLPYSQQWNSSDLVLSCTSHLSMYTFTLHLAAIVVGASLALPEKDSPTDLFKLVAEVKPTILISDDDTMKSLAGRADRLKILGMIKLQMANSTLSKGIMPSMSVALNSFKSARLIHTSYNSLNTPDRALTTKETNIIRALTGARVIHALCSPICASPLAQTQLYDYRLGADNVINYGPVLPCLEAILKDHGLYSAQDKKGQLWIRGPACKETWTNTGIIGEWGIDGTLRLYA